MANTYECMCGKNGLEVTGEPALAVWCHCHSCQVYATDAMKLAAFKPEQFKYTKGGDDDRIKYESSKDTYRISCKTCGSFVNKVLGNGLVVCGLGGMKFGGAPIKPTMHIFYAEATTDVKDDLPKHDGWAP